MHPLRLLLAVMGLVLPVLAAPPLELHRGSTREWVKYTGSAGASIRYNLEFLDSTRRDTTTFKATDWRVRVTIPDSPRVVDTAILRVMHESIPLDRFPSNLSYWLKASVHFAIDVQNNPVDEVSKYSSGGLINTFIPILPTGALELTLVNNAFGMKHLQQRTDGTVCTTTLGGGFCGTPPSITTKDKIGITAWLGRGSFWILKTADGRPLPTSPGSLGHRLKNGESWVYRDSSASMASTKIMKSYVSLQLLALPSDSSGWTRLSVRKSTHPDSGTPSDTTLSILLDTLRRFVRMGADSGTPWRFPKKLEARWALGLMKHPIFPDSAKSRYKEMKSYTVGEINPSGSTEAYQMLLDNNIGSTSISSSYQSPLMKTGAIYDTWTLIAHSLDNTALAVASNAPKPSHNLAWLRDRIAQNPALEIIRIAPDGSSTRARGTEALKLLDARGVGFVQMRDDQELVTLRVIRP